MSLDNLARANLLQCMNVLLTMDKEVLKEMEDFLVFEFITINDTKTKLLFKKYLKIVEVLQEMVK